ncbi:sigma-70 family RNA polymerase sigma factor [Streptomyces sp. NPDC090052]|uniref:sigma-70 family RNA polymerase sigma factor n=1 Tax=unclassified Streptomyces TaxID=2593676 RepID=UPI00224E6C2B|nr:MULTISPECIES: sigma-70 family RNA polymerase sigma factor [unclassified Streptomyces]MCX4724348.1 sigma-70 family RNA polymerase sigma factor [Streptomyces sp. NBC_01306]WSV06132.1 sigma-70 family RNA polymerase sigma factor [Streptomyces sp. NBC_01020]WSX44251.1 sigma-70 family RNA polymerase sigma factor [Streptomyces sp. NBC_00963]
MQRAYELYGGELFGYVYNALRDRQLAEDVVQETFIRAWKSSGGFDPRRGSLRTWLFSIARNGAIDAMRRRGVRDAVGVDFREALAEEPARHDPVEVLLEHIQLDEALNRLSAEHRQTVVSVYYGGRTCAELAAEWGISASTVRSRLYYGVRALRLVLEENGWLAP